MKPFVGRRRPQRLKHRGANALLLLLLLLLPSLTLQVCTKFADPVCVAASTIAACIQQDLDDEYFLTHPRTSPAKLAPAAIAGIAVGAAAGVAALLAATVLLLVRRSKHSKQQTKMASLLPVSGLPKHLQSGSDSGSGSGSVGSGRGRRGSKDSSTDSVDSLVRPKSIQMTPDSARGGSIDSCGSSACRALAVGSPSVLKARAAGLPTIVKGTLTEGQAADVHLGE